MGSKTPEGDYQGPPNGSSTSTEIVDINPPKSSTASGLLPGIFGGTGEDGDEEDDDHRIETAVRLDDEAVNAIKRKRKNKKKKSKASSKQSAPPRTALADLFKDSLYPSGEIVEYVSCNENLQRTTAEELRYQAATEIMDADFMSDYCKAAETHRQVRQYVQTIARPGVSMSKLVQEIEDGVRALVGHDGIETGDGLKAGLGFPTGLALNNVAAHWTPNPGSKEVILQHNDMLKIDFGVHVNGRIVDSAFTVAANPVYDNLLAAVRAATNTGLKESGIDVRISDISASIQETMESYEVELNGKTIPVKAIRGLTGHDILRYKIHGTKQVPFVANKSPTNQRMEEGDVFAIETFGSTGSGYIRDDHSLGVYGYGRNANADTSGLRLASAKALLKTIDANFGTLVFSRRQLEHLGVRSYHLGLKALIDQGIVQNYDPLVEIPGSHVAQFEHTILLKPSAKEIISRGEDY